MDFLLGECPTPYLPVYLDLQGMFCVVDREDFTWATQWHWFAKWDRHKRKAYAFRSVGGVSIFLHKEICLRANGPPPTPRHHVGDHKDGQSLNCRRQNMRWATLKENRANIDGAYARQMRLMLERQGWPSNH